MITRWNAYLKRKSLIRSKSFAKTKEKTELKQEAKRSEVKSLKAESLEAESLEAEGLEVEKPEKKEPETKTLVATREKAELVPK